MGPKKLKKETLGDSGNWSTYRFVGQAALSDVLSHDIGDSEPGLGPEQASESESSDESGDKLKRKSERDLRVWRSIPISQGGMVETAWRQRATAKQLKTKQEFDECIHKLRVILQNSFYKNNKSHTLGFALRQRSDESVNQYAIAAAVGPLVVAELIEQGEFADFRMDAFIGKLSDANLDKNVVWATCRKEVLNNLDRFTNPAWNVDLKKFIDSKSIQSRIGALDRIEKAIPNDFDAEEFIAAACEDEPATVCLNASVFLKQGFDFPISEIIAKYQAEVRRNIKFEVGNENKLHRINNYRENIGKLVRDYKEYGKINAESEQRFLNELNWFYEEVVEEEKIITTADEKETLQETIDSFNEKFQNYLDQYVLISKQPGDTKSLAEIVIKKFNKDELSYLRQMFISYSPVYNKDNIQSYMADLSNGTRALFHQALEKLNGVDYGFKESDEYTAYLEREKEKIKRERRKEIEEMSKEELHDFRMRRMEYELNNTEPVSYENEMGLFDLNKFTKSMHIRELFFYDDGWEESEEYAECRRKQNEESAAEYAELLAKYPEIFDNPDLDRIDHKIEDIIKIIPRAKVYEIGKLKEAGKYRQSDRAMVDLFVELFGLDISPRIIYIDKEERCKARYNYKLGAIEIKRSFGGRDDELGLADTVAHEMMHYLQHEEIKRRTDDGKKYRINIEHYQNAEIDWWDLHEAHTAEDINNSYKSVYDRYKKQLMEVEAFRFGETFAAYYAEIIENGITNTPVDSDAELDQLIKTKEIQERLESMGGGKEMLENVSELIREGIGENEIIDYLCNLPTESKTAPNDGWLDLPEIDSPNADSAAIQDLLLAIYMNGQDKKSRVEAAISYILSMRGIEDREEREKEKTRYYFAMIGRLAENNI